jgi:hypothetical protein
MPMALVFIMNRDRKLRSDVKKKIKKESFLIFERIQFLKALLHSHGNLLQIQGALSGGGGT